MPDVEMVVVALVVALDVEMVAVVLVVAVQVVGLHLLSSFVRCWCAIR